MIHSIYDNMGKTFDRYTVNIIREDGTCELYGMSHNPFSPQGFNQYCGDYMYTPKNEIELYLEECPETVQKAILDRLE